MRLGDLDALREKIDELEPYIDCDENSTTWILSDEVYNAIDNAPTVERPQGEWKVYGKQGGIPITDMCSNCRYEMKWYKNKYKFCPNCGAKMRKGGAE